MKVLFAALLFFASLFTVQAQDIDGAIAAIRKQNYKQVESMLSSHADGKNPAASFYLGHAYYLMAMEALDNEQRDALLAKSIETHDRAIGRRTKDAFNYIGKAYYYMAKGNLTEANSQLATARSLDSDEVRALTEGAIAYMKLFDHPLADQQIKRLAADNASIFISRAESKAGENLEVLNASGYVYFLQGVHSLAEAKFQKVLSQDAGNIDARFKLAQAFFAQSKYDNTERELLEVIKRDPKFAPAYKEIAEFYYYVARSGFKSEEYFDKAKQYAGDYRNLVGDDKVANQRYAALLYFTGSHEECVKEVEKLMQDPKLADNLSLKRLRAYSLAELGRYEEAKQAMDDVMSRLKTEEKAALDYKTLGIIYLGVGDDAKATENIAQAIRLDPDNKNTWKELYEKAKADKDWEKAQLYLLKHLDIAEKPGGRDMYMAAWLCYRNKDNENCIKWSDKAFEVYPTVGELLLYKARAQGRIEGKARESMKTYKQFLKLMDTLGEEEQAKNKDEIGEAAFAIAFYYYDDEVEQNYPRSYKYTLMALDSGAAKYTESATKLRDFFDGQKIEPEQANAADVK